MNKQMKVIIGLVLVLVIALGYIVYNYQADKSTQKDLEIRQDERIQMLISIYQTSDNCGVVSFNIGNVSRSLIDVNCMVQGDANG